MIMTEDKLSYKTPYLHDEVIELHPFKGLSEFDYLFELADLHKYTKVQREEVESLVLCYGIHFWTGYNVKTKEREGVVYLSRYPWLGYSLDAYKEDKGLPARVYSMSAANLVLGFFFDNVGNQLFTTHSVENRAATALCKRLGFKTISEYDSIFGRFILMLRSKGE